MRADPFFAAITPSSVNPHVIMMVKPPAVNPNLIMFVSPASVNPDLIMRVTPPSSAAANLAGDLTKQFVHDLYESLPAGAVTESAVKNVMGQVKTYLLTGQGLSTSFGALAGLITASTAAPASAEAGKELASLITGSMVKDIITLVAPTISAADVRSSIALLKTDLNTGLGIEPWLKSMESTYGGLVPTSAHTA